MPYLTPPPEQQRRLQALMANLQEQDRLISVIGEALLAGYNAAVEPPPRRFVRVTSDGRVEYKWVAYTGPRLVEDDGPGDQSEPDEAA